MQNLLNSLLQKIQPFLASIKPALQNLAKGAPFLAGVVAGYLGHGMIKLVVDALMGMLKLMFKL